MSLIGKLRNAEHQGKEAALQGFARARLSLEEAQSRIRQKMRLRPRSAKPPLPVFVSLHEKEESAPPRPIVTINGQDLPPEEADTAETSDKHVA